MNKIWKIIKALFHYKSNQDYYEMWYQKTIDIKNQCSEDNWDGYGAQKGNSYSFNWILWYISTMKYFKLCKYIDDVVVDTGGCFILDVVKNKSLISLCFGSNEVNYFIESEEGVKHPKDYCSDNLNLGSRETELRIMEEIKSL